MTDPMKLIGIIVANEVLAAFLKSKPNTDISMETNSVPPPIPIPALNRATKKPSNINLISNRNLTDSGMIKSSVYPV